VHSWLISIIKSTHRSLQTCRYKTIESFFDDFVYYISRMKTKVKFTAVFEEAEEGGYIAFIEELPGVNTQGETLEESKANLLEALDLVLQTQREITEKELGKRKYIKETLEFA
jgi:predicted RNase H-like HicB family nuclease